MNGMFVVLRFSAARKNSYEMAFGPSNELGRIEITRDQILREARKSMELFLMDYAEIESVWTGKLRVTPMNREAIRCALSAFRRFQSSYQYPLGYEESLKTADVFLAQKGKASLTAAVEQNVVGLIAVETVPVLAE
jgi:hypothetical protein